MFSSAHQTSHFSGAYGDGKNSAHYAGGRGALKFALDNGFTKENFDRTPGADEAWKEWLKKSEYKPIINFENHDTIGMIALDMERKSFRLMHHQRSFL
jgi:hypothetical protein